MTEKEIYLLEKELNNCSCYLEFGSGNSTIRAVKIPTIQTITSVESDKDFWDQLVKSELLLQDSIHDNRLQPLLVDIGEVKKWGYPVDLSLQDKWPLYSSECFKKNTCLYDLILVDGRFRIACILQACLHRPAGTKILVHDFFSRPSYFVVLPFLEFVEQADDMGLFMTKDIDNNKEIIQEFISIYQYQPAL